MQSTGNIVRCPVASSYVNNGEYEYKKRFERRDFAALGGKQVAMKYLLVLSLFLASGKQSENLNPHKMFGERPL